MYDGDIKTLIQRPIFAEITSGRNPAVPTVGNNSINFSTLNETDATINGEINIKINTANSVNGHENSNGFESIKIIPPSLNSHVSKILLSCFFI